MGAVIHWFRRDLRVTDNPALSAACAAGGEVVPVYVLSDWKGFHRWTGSNRMGFLCGCLRSLAGNLESLGGRLIFRKGEPVAELLALARETGATAVYFNRDPDPHGRSVEDRLLAAASSEGIAVHAFKDACLHEREEVLTGSGEPFRVFTPYYRAWLKIPKDSPQGAIRKLRVPSSVSSLPQPEVGDWGLAAPASLVVEPGERAARERMRRFLSGPVSSYGNRRDIPSAGCTSRLSQDLRHGLISVRELYSRCTQAMETLDAGARTSVSKFVSEVAWREFYMQILWHFPDVLQEEFSPRFRGISWPGDASVLERWKSGETGFPIVDAAMRELKETGFMHNRTRMIAAMFLTKDLLVDWRAGEQWFMQNLVDGEIASNNGGWQWSAGTGADAAPYFRIQNPWTQTKRYDPDAAYIKQWVPELRDVPAEKLCDPPEPGTRLHPSYPAPMLDHAAARDRALEHFSKHGGK